MHFAFVVTDKYVTSSSVTQSRDEKTLVVTVEVTVVVIVEEILVDCVVVCDECSHASNLSAPFKVTAEFR